MSVEVGLIDTVTGYTKIIIGDAEAAVESDDREVVADFLWRQITAGIKELKAVDEVRIEMSEHVQHAFSRGLQDGLELEGRPLTSGMTYDGEWDSEDQNEGYDQGVTVGELLYLAGRYVAPK